MASETKTTHTPGPWYVADTGFVLGSHDGFTVADPRCEHPNGVEDTLEANARLIAAAPDYYAIVSEFVEVMDNPDIDSWQRLAAIRMKIDESAAIAAATGEGT